MSQNPAKAEPKPEVTIVPSETPLVDTSKQEVIIDTTTGKPAENVVTTPSFDPNEIERKISNKLFYELRQMEKRNKELLESYARPQQVRPARNAEQSDEDSQFEEQVEQVAQHDWKRAVDLRAERLAKKIASEQIAKFQESQAKAREEESLKQSILQSEERSKQRVLKEFPELLDESSDTFRNYMGIFNREIAEDPYFMNNPRKYEIVANEFRSKAGYQQAQNPEVERLKRVAAGSSTSQRTVQPGNRITLTQEEIDFCDQSGIPYSTYSRNRKIMDKGGFKEGLELKS